MRGMAFFALTLYVRNTRKCHREACRAGWQFPDVTRPEIKVRGRPICILTLYVRKTGKCHRSSKAAHRPTAKGHGDHQPGPQDHREDGLVLLRKKFEVQQALFEVGAADADADFVTEAVDLVGAAAAQAVFLLFKLEEIRLYVTE